MNSEKEIDLTNTNRDVWLVKVPKYVSNLWEKAAKGSTYKDVGKLQITPPTPQDMRRQMGKSSANIYLTLSDEALSVRDPQERIPHKFQFSLTKMHNTQQSLVAFSQPQLTDDDYPLEPQAKKLRMEGTINQKGECRPIVDDNYMSMTKRKILKASEPQRIAKQLNTVVQSYKPVSDHKHNIEYEMKKKAEGKKSREDKEKVHDMLFAAFEKHQYYNVKDLEKITKQPVPYLKEILKEICIYNTKNPHKNMWELKREYRHYKDSEEGSAAS